ncbi:MAG TPA: Asp-tRNA(Asn)/Glu-tRNA(Gln) amidotransferase subunit GatC [Candidatus Binatia bacterium]
MKISPEDLHKVATLARLRLTGEEEARFAAELEKILGYMEKLNEVRTTGTAPFTHAIEAVNRFRPDQVTNQADLDTVLGNAPERDGPFFKVPKIIE